jgi:phosphate transport system permease protein
MPEATQSALPAGSPSVRRRSFTVSSSKARRVKLVDRLADGVIRVGGVLVIAAIALIFVFIVREVVPLFFPATVGPAQVHRVTAPGAAVALLAGSDEFETTVFVVRPDGAVELRALKGWAEGPTLRSARLGERRLTAASLAPSGGFLFLGTDDGHVALARLRFEPSFSADGARTITPSLEDLALVRLPGAGGAVTRVVGRASSAGALSFVAQTVPGLLVVVTVTPRGLERAEDTDGLLAAPDAEDVLDGPFQVRTLAPLDGPVTALAIDSEADRLFAATARGTLYQWQLAALGSTPFATFPVPGAVGASEGLREPTPADATRRITALDLLLGDQTLVVGYDDGTLEGWLGVRQSPDDALKRARPVRQFDPLPGAVVALRPSGRDKTFLAASADGTAHLVYASSGRTLASVQLEGGAPLELAYGAKLTSALALSREGTVDYRTVDDPHPDSGWGLLFGRVWYEGYDEPDFVWQSSSGSDAFEPKYSLVPLIVGTLKGAFYGLLFAVPLALLAALYTSQFLSSSMRAIVKPLVEVMAALPSVVIGFMAGLWLAPVLEDKLPALLFFGLVLPLLVLLVTALWRLAPRALKRWLPEGREVFLLVPLVALTLWGAVALAPWLDVTFFHGDLKQWVFDTFAVRVEQRNSIVVGIAMGFAVIPMIFTISDDAFTNVPKSTVSASLALGASRWQTAIRVVAPTASPGVFSAVMIGFGRAVGETMIVLMATGNTPVLSFSPFNGMRTLSANIAVEIPEAPLGETHYRILFLAALLLFVLTFVVNTAAELLRHRLREKYQTV